MKYCTVLVLMGALLHANIVGGIAVLVNNEPITLFEIEQNMHQEHLSAKQSVKKLIRQRLETLEIKERRLHVSSEEVLNEIKNMARQNGMNISQFYMAMQQSRGISERELKKKVKEKLLNTKLYNSIAYAKLSQPSRHEIEEYFHLHKEQFSRPESFEVILYHSNSPQKLEQQISTPMFYSSDIQTQEMQLNYGDIDPGLANLLYRTKVNNFTQIVPDPNGGYMTFFIKAKSKAETTDLDAYAAEVSAAILADKRNQVLNDYFARLRLNADIKVLRMPE